jgi:hypothetical protein
MAASGSNPTNNRDGNKFTRMVKEDAMKPSQLSLGPWTTSLDSGLRLELSTFWQRRMSALPGLREAHRSSRRTAWMFIASIAAMLAMTPQLQFVPGRAVADEPKVTDDSISRLRYRANALNEEEQKLLAAWRKESAAAAMKLAETGHYSLEEEEVARFVPASVGGEARRQFADLNDDDHERVSFVMRVEDGRLDAPMSHYGDSTVGETIDWLFGIKRHRMEGDDALIDLPMPEGDWVFASYDPREKAQVSDELVEAIERTLSKALDEPLQVELRKVERPVLVARGNYKFTAIPGEDGKIEEPSDRVRKIADSFFFPARRDETIGSVGRFNELLEDVGELLLTPIVDEITARPAKPDFFWKFPRKPHVKSRTPLDPKMAAEVRGAFIRQTGLKLSEEIRPVDVLFITRETAAAEESR